MHVSRDMGKVFRMAEIIRSCAIVSFITGRAVVTHNRATILGYSTDAANSHVLYVADEYSRSGDAVVKVVV